MGQAPQVMTDERGIALRHAIEQLCLLEPRFAIVEATAGDLVFSPYPPGFETLCKIIISQQLATTAAASIFQRLLAAAGGQLTPEWLEAQSVQTLRSLGLSTSKAQACYSVARASTSGELNLIQLAEQNADSIASKLMSYKGLGPWTVNLYMLFALQHPDVWPASDLALQRAAQLVFSLPKAPSLKEMQALGEPLRPWRGAAAHLLWHCYRNKARFA